ncbi:MAG: response regulator transcription factor [Acidimicrobiia bacterium]|nr:response regulator transcription factor [Acidimicrobiia bacterium]MDX2468130.1 response regulator transcription factor [Acidimicrobiia bacterium]
MTPNKILIVDDEASIRTLVRSYLEADKFEVLEGENGAEAISLTRANSPDLVVMDVGMPVLDGLEALREIRTFSDVYVVMLTARSDEVDKVIGLSVGADDYLTKPFSPRELIARIKAVLRRQRGAAAPSDADRLVFSELVIDLGRREVSVADSAADLTTLEFDLLAALAAQPGRVFSRRQLIEAIWGWDYFGDERVVDVHIRKLRKALGDEAGEPRIIGTVRGVGYRFIPES